MRCFEQQACGNFRFKKIQIWISNQLIPVRIATWVFSFFYVKMRMELFKNSSGISQWQNWADILGHATETAQNLPWCTLARSNLGFLVWDYVKILCAACACFLLLRRDTVEFNFMQATSRKVLNSFIVKALENSAHLAVDSTLQINT